MPIEFHRDGPWELPEGWVWATLRDLASLRGEKAPPNSASEFPFVGMDDVPANSLRIQTIGEFRSMKSAGNKFYSNDLLYGRLRPYLNKVVVADFEGVASGEFIVMCAPDGIEPRYLQLFMHGRRFVNLATADTSGDRPRIDFDKIAEIEIPLAPTTEQRRIVTRVDELFTEIADGEALLARARDDLDTWRRALLKATVTGELTREWREQNATTESGSDALAEARLERDHEVARAKGRRLNLIPPSDEIKLPTIPNNWAWGQLGDFLVAIEAGLNIKAEGHPPRVDEVGIVKISAVTWDEFDEAESKTLPADARIDENDLIRPGDLLISRANTLELVGAPVIVRSCERRLVLSDKVLRLCVVRGFHRWIEFCLKSPIGRYQIEHYASGNQLSMRNITQENIARLAIPVPPRDEVEEAIKIFVECNESRDDGRIAVEGADRTATSLRQSILKAAFEGRLVEQDPRDDPADRLLAQLGGKTDTRAQMRRTIRKSRATIAAE
jgi:type I restriction enzyme S subunit